MTFRRKLASMGIHAKGGMGATRCEMLHGDAILSRAVDWLKAKLQHHHELMDIIHIEGL